MGYHIPTQNGLTAMAIAAAFILICSMISIYLLLIQMELQKTLALPENLEFVEDDHHAQKSRVPTNDDSEQFTGRLRVSKSRKGILAGIVAIITLLSYLLLVRNESPAWLAWVGMGVILVVLLSGHIFDEIRRQRLDRVSGVLTCVLLMTMALHLMVYAQQQVADGQIHQGKARITGYDLSVYDQNKGKESVTRTDLTVAWGGSWGCPSSPSTYCEAVLQGALCETDVENGNRRYLADNQNGQNEEGGQANNEEHENNNEEGKDEGADGDKDEQANQQQQNGDGADEGKDEQNGDGEDGQKNDNNQKQQNGDQEDGEKNQQQQEEEGNEEEEEGYGGEAEDGYTYFFDDDFFTAGYWDNQDWNSVWGGYACQDLFDEELGNSMTYDPEEPPGDDAWPFVNIYGNCKTCEAYVVDYFSTEHFQNILNVKKSAINYAIAASLSLVVTVLLLLKQRLNPTADQEIELLSRHGTSSYA